MLGSKQLRIYRAVSVTREPTLLSALHDTRFSARDLALDSLLASLSRIFPNSCVSFSVVIFLSVSTLMSLMSCVSLPVFLCSFSMSVNSSSGNPKLISFSKRSSWRCGYHHYEGDDDSFEISPTHFLQTF